MATPCYSVRLESLTLISPICYKAVGFDGSTALIPAKFVYGKDYDVLKSDAYWIAEWILDKKDLTFSRKKKAYFTRDGRKIPETEITEHIPGHVSPVADNELSDLAR